MGTPPGANPRSPGFDLPSHGDVDAALRRGRHTPPGSAASVAKHRVPPTGENCRHPPTLAGQLSTANGIDASRHAVGSPFFRPKLDCLGTESEPEQVPAGDHPVLSLRERPGFCIT